MFLIFVLFTFFCLLSCVLASFFPMPGSKEKGLEISQDCLRTARRAAGVAHI